LHKITNANIKEWAKNYDGPLFDGILCDPPYELGFMGKSWDSSGIAFDTEMWADIYKLLKPGGHLLAFSGSRTYHRMAVAIEDAGFEIRDMIEWVYGSGFPKSLNVGKAVDKIQGNEREVVGEQKLQGTARRMKGGNYGDFGGEDTADVVDLTKGTSPYEGYGTALKPAHEPCVLARKPLDKGMTVANNVLKHGTGGLNIDGTRVGTTEYAKDIGTKRPQSDDYVFKSFDDNTRPSGSGATSQLGRFPANLIHDGSDEVEAVFPHTKSQAGVKNLPTSNIYGGNSLLSSKTVGTGQVTGFTDSGSASRFFYTAKSSRAERNAGLDGTVSIKVQLEICENNTTRQENLAQLQVVMDSSHLKATAESGIGTKSGTEWSMSLFGSQYTEKYLPSTKSTTSTTTSSITTSAILNYLTGLLTNESTLGVSLEMANGGNHANDVESSSTLAATISDQTALVLGASPAQASKRLLISVSDGKNFHSTVKPLSLTKYLATLIKPPTGGRLLVPFSGSGSEMIGALQAGWEEVIGVELTEEYIPIAEARIKYWLEQKEAESNQLELV
jgi:site-specific DNA-methyltransferase (adenine-specific)